jgi:HK97 family phage major capsid protein
MSLKELLEKLQAKRNELHVIFEEAGEDMDMSKVKSIEGDSQAKVEAMRALNTEIDDLQKQVETLEQSKALEQKAIEADRARKGAGGPNGDTKEQPGERKPQTKSLGHLFTESAAFKNKGETSELDIGLAEMGIGLKTLFETGVGWAPENIRTGKVVDIATRPLQVVDIMPMNRTGQAAIVYMEETIFDNTAVEVDEGDPYPEAALKLTEQTAPVRKIGVFLPVTDEQMEDVPQVTGYVNNRLVFMVRQRLDLQILVGDGISPNLTGILNTGGILTQAKGGDPTPDAFFKAMTLVKVTGQAFPNNIVMHPNDWQSIRLLRTADGIYIWGSPSEVAPQRLWGLPVTEAQAITENTGLVGDFSFIELTERRGIEVKVSDSHSDFFIKGKQAIRADMRVGMPVYRPAAFCTVTGI